MILVSEAWLAPGRASNLAVGERFFALRAEFVFVFGGAELIFLPFTGYKTLLPLFSEF